MLDMVEFSVCKDVQFIGKICKNTLKNCFFSKTSYGKREFGLAYALILGIAHAEDNKNEFNKLIYPPNIDYFTQQALQLCRDAIVI